MLTLPSPRRFLLPALLTLAVLSLTRLLTPAVEYGQVPLLRPSTTAHTSRLLHAALRRPIVRGVVISRARNGSRGYGDLGDDAYDDDAVWYAAYLSPAQQQQQQEKPKFPPAHARLARFLACDAAALNPLTSHLRLSAVMHNISVTAPTAAAPDPAARFFNPAIIPLPYWAASVDGRGAKYVLVSRLVTTGYHQESHVCLADICAPARRLNATGDGDGQGAEDEDKTLLASSPDTRACTALDMGVLGARGGMRCTTEPVKINVPSTPAATCAAAWRAFPDIPGFHDPRLFWSGKGEPLILVNSASRYGCVGLWVVDLRVVLPLVADVLDVRRRARSRNGRTSADDGVAATGSSPRIMSYPHLTEITRNPRSSRSLVEKNWLMWFPNHDDAYVQYDMMGQRPSGGDTVGIMDGTFSESIAKSRANTTRPRIGGRTFAKLTGNGFTTRNLTSPHELSCFTEAHDRDVLGNLGHWHQGSNALRLLLCTRAEARMGRCDEQDAVDDGRSLHFAVVHRKFSNVIHLPLRYERYVLVWEGRKPFRNVGVSKFPLLMRDEWARPWSAEENWPERRTRKGFNKGNWTVGESNISRKRWMTGKQGRTNITHDSEDQKHKHEDQSFQTSAYFTYTPSLTWAWKPHSAGLGEADEDDVEYMSRLGLGYLGDEVILGIGMDDVNQGFAKVKVDELLQCLRLCPGVDIARED